MTPGALTRRVSANARLCAFALIVLSSLSAASATAAAAIITVDQGGDLQAALNAAQPGDEIVLQAGARFVGQFVLPVKAAGAVITVRSSALLPARRLTPADASLLPTLVSGSTASALSGYGATNWRLDGLRFEANAWGEGNIISLQDAMAITMDRLLIVAGSEGQKRAIMGNGRQITLSRSYIAGIWRSGQDSQAFCAWDGAGPYTVKDNYLEAASENVLFGGANSKSADRVPADILVEGNHFSKPIAWKGQPRTVKNLFELKSAKRVVIRSNLFERNWTDAQNGFAILFTVRNDEGGSPWSVIEDVLFENNVVRETENGINLLGYDSYQASGRATRITVRNNLVVASGIALQMGSEVGVLTFDHNTFRQGYNFATAYKGSVFVAGTNAPRLAAYAVETLTMTNNLASHNDYGFIGEDAGIGTSALLALTRSYTWTHNVLAGEAGWGQAYPVVTWQPAMADHLAQFNVDSTLTATSTYRGAATNGTDLGWAGTGVTATTPPPPSSTTTPPPPPPPAVDSTDPVVTVRAVGKNPKAQKYRITATDDMAVTSIQVWFLNRLLLTTASSPVDVDLPISSLSKGYYPLTVTAKDGAGNATTVTETVSIK
jgi:hypothetical protein